MVKTAREQRKTVLSGADVFKLYDTYGFPLDLSREMAEETGLSVDEEDFKARMEEQRNRARAARGNVSGWADTEKTALGALPKTTFVGYETLSCEARVLALLGEGGTVEEAIEGDLTVVTDKTPFYGEAGGQVGDVGTLLLSDGTTVPVLDTKKTDGVYLHIVHLTDGRLRVGDTVTLTVDGARRDAIRRNHSACHLLQAALRRVLGTHVEQAGSYVDGERVRFDFTHFAAMTPSELRKTEALVNEEILRAEPIRTEIMAIEDARKTGAMMLFDDKYGDTVRVVSMGDFSREFCGGTHAASTGSIGLFHILSETSVAAGVRRIEGVTGYGVLSLLAEREAMLAEGAKIVHANSLRDFAHRAAALAEEVKNAKREVEKLNQELSSTRLGAFIGQAREVGPFKVLTAHLNVRPDVARAMCDEIKATHPEMVAVLAIVSDGRLNFVACCGADAVKAGAHAGNILRAVAAVTGGKGGGRPDSAMSGGADISKIPEALALVQTLLPQA